MKKFILPLFYFYFSSTIVFAGGIQTNFQGQKQTGMGHTGTGILLDNACILFNPGAVSFLDSLRGFSLGGNFIFARTAYLETFPGTSITQTKKATAAPFTLYAVYKFDKTSNWNIGLGLYNPFSNKIKWADDWTGQFLVRETNFKILYIQPTVSLKLNDKWGIGIGFIYATGNYMLRKGIPIQDTAGHYGEELLRGKANGIGMNAGIYFKVSEKLSIGIDFRSAVNAKIKGYADFVVAHSLTTDFKKTKFSTDINLPQVISVGVGYKVNSKLQLALDINYTGWSTHDSLIINYAENPDKHNDLHAARMYKDSYVFRIGGQYDLTTKWTLRLGSFYDMSPVPNGYFSPEVPDADELGITAGATFYVTKKIYVDASLVYIEGMKRTDSNLQTQFGGTYKTKTVIPGISFGFSF
ncbi:MAG: OmpP1/FadL family transporter [Bacteroidota bacterium]